MVLCFAPNCTADCTAETHARQDRMMVHVPGQGRRPDIAVLLTDRDLGSASRTGFLRDHNLTKQAQCFQRSFCKGNAAFSGWFSNLVVARPPSRSHRHAATS